jgi:hypothetical protein
MALMRVTAAAPSEPAAGHPAPAATGVGQITGKPATRAEWIYYAIGYGVLAVGAVIGIFAARHWHPTGADKNTFVPIQGVSIFGALYVVTQALERLLEPLASLYGQTAPPADADMKDGASVGAGELKGTPPLGWISKSLATRMRNDALKEAAAKAGSSDAAERGAAETAADRAATWQQLIDQVSSNRATLWAVASGIGMVISGGTGLLLLHAIDKGKWDVPRWFDVLATGLVIGGGTKPLHDLISNIQASKEAKTTPAESGGSSPGTG